MQEASETTCPIRRLIIIHINLAKLCTGEQLDETATSEELRTQILYFHQDASIPSEDDGDIRFAGLCAALYSLPNTLQTITGNENRGGADVTKEVQLDDSTLVFVPIEANSFPENPLILGVAQITRPSTKSNSNGVDPFAIRASMERWHKLFILLRGGGIHERLAMTLSNSKSSHREEVHKSPYPGMDELFRKQQETVGRSVGPISEEKEGQNPGKEIEALYKKLPISSLREDLRFHYDTYVGDFCSNRVGVGRCLVESVPAPIPLNNEEHTAQWLPSYHGIEESFQISCAVKQFLSDQSMTHSDNAQSRVLAVSTFFQGRHLFQHKADGAVEKDSCRSSLLLWYFAFYKNKVKQQQEHQERFSVSKPPRRLSRGLISFSDHTTVTTMEDRQSTNDFSHPSFGMFLEKPPLAMLSASDQKDCAVSGPNGILVWAPLVFFLDRNAAQPQQAELVHAILWEWKGYSFLLYLRPAEPLTVSDFLDRCDSSLSAHKECGMRALLEEFSVVLGKCLEDLKTVQGAALSQVASKDQPKQLSTLDLDAILIDRSTSEMSLFRRSQRKSSTNTKSPKIFFDVLRRSPLASTTTTELELSATSIHERVEGMDCRHCLASTLPPEALLAFDDIMSDVSARRQERPQIAASLAIQSLRSDRRSYEVLTTTPQGWIYAFADRQDRELYIFLDAREYVTIEDVQHVTSLARKSLL